MAARRGDFTRAIELTREIDKLSKTSPMGALLRARIYAAQGKTRDLAQAYKEALDRDPRQLELRVLLGQPSSSSEKPMTPFARQTWCSTSRKTGVDASLLQARALAESGTTPTEKDQQQRAAIARLEAVTKANPHFEEAFHTLAEIHFKRNEPCRRRRRLEGRPQGQSHRRRGRFTA